MTYQEPGDGLPEDVTISDEKENTMSLPRLEALLAPYAASQKTADRAVELRVKRNIERSLGR